MTPVFRHGGLRLYLLKLLDEAPRHGYEVIRLLQDRFLGVYSPSPGTIYPRLNRLEEEGLVTHEEVDGKKVYRITEKGRQELRDRITELTALEAELTASARGIAQEIGRDVRESVRSLREELSRAARGYSQTGAGQARPGPGKPGPGKPGPGKPEQPEPEQTRFTKPGPEPEAGPGPRPGDAQCGFHEPWKSSWLMAGTWQDLLDRLATQFASDIQDAAASATSRLDETGLSGLRSILADALTRIKVEVFDSGQPEPSQTEPDQPADPPDQSATTG